MHVCTVNTNMNSFDLDTRENYSIYFIKRSQEYKIIYVDYSVLCCAAKGSR